MTKPTFTLTTGAEVTIQEGPAPKTVNVPLAGHSSKTIKKKALVSLGSLIADHPAKHVGDLHSPIQGIVAEVTATMVVIKEELPKVKEGEEPPAFPEVELAELSDIDGDDLAAILKSLGVSTKTLKKTGMIILNAVNPEPGLNVHEVLLKTERETLSRGLAVLEKLAAPSEVKLVVSQEGVQPLHGTTVVKVSDKYPSGLELFVTKAATGHYGSEGVHVVSLLELWSLGRVVETGLPLTETVINVNGKVLKAKVGTPVSELLDEVGAQYGPKDTVILGGPMRGEALSDLSIGIGKWDQAITVIPNGTFPPLTDMPCINCGECVLRCPVKLSPGVLSRYAEFQLWDKAKKENIAYCIECGICGYVCPSRRPMLQYIRIAKQEIAAIEAQTASCRLTGE